MPDQIRIAIVDDNVRIRESLAGLLDSVGLGVAVFSSAEDFLNQRNLNQFSCLITDVKMTGISGFELQRRLVRCGWHGRIIFMSAFYEKRRVEETLALGALVYLLKPLDGDELLCWVDRAFRDDSEKVFK